MAGPKVTIAGAGCAGLAAGIALQRRGYDVTILERAERAGGLAGGIQIHGNTYEYGPHIFHTTDPEIRADVERIAGHVLIPFEKTIKIKFLGQYFAFPLVVRDVIFKLPAPVVMRAAFSLIRHAVAGAIEGEAGLTNSEKVLQRYYGDVLYKIFFKDYITKVWGIEPAHLSPSFARQRVPRLDPLDVIHKLRRRLFPPRSKPVGTEGYVEKVEGVHYTTATGFCAIVEAFVDEFKKSGGLLILNAPVKAIQMEKGRVDSVIYETGTGPVTAQTAHHISTVPISLLPAMMTPKPPQHVLDAAAALRFRGTLFVGLLVKKSPVLPASFMYFRDKSFNRITDLGQFKVKIEPEGCTILIAEVMAQPEDPEWKNEEVTAARVKRELTAEGLLTESDVLETHVFKTEFAYPVYSLDYEAALATVLGEVSKHENLHTIGRQGRFAYINTHIAFKMGYDVARKIDDVRV